MGQHQLDKGPFPSNIAAELQDIDCIASILMHIPCQGLHTSKGRPPQNHKAPLWLFPAFAHYTQQPVCKHSLQCQSFDADSSPGKGHCHLTKTPLVEVMSVLARCCCATCKEAAAVKNLSDAQSMRIRHTKPSLRAGHTAFRLVKSEHC